MAECIVCKKGRSTYFGDANVSAEQIVSGCSLWGNQRGLISGTMANRGAISASINQGQSYTIPVGYHNGSGRVTANIDYSKLNLHTETITYTQNWTVPNHIGTIDVRIFGGGGGGCRDGAGAAGGGGWMNNRTINISNGQVIPITIGSGGMYGNSSSIVVANRDAKAGGTSSFGTYLSANGGEGGKGSGTFKGGDGGAGGGGTNGGRGYQFGGGGGQVGGAGGIWGGGGGSGLTNYTAGAGGTYGGGGATGHQTTSGYYQYTGNGGRGGTYGGGGGGANYGGRGGSYGGNGGGRNSTSYPLSNGTNTSTWTNVHMINNAYLRGNGTRGTGGAFAGGGGFGGCGGKDTGTGGGGGGGYGGNGGNGSGGGGGYGGNGGDGGSSVGAGGGGGGYGSGADGGTATGGGGGYFSHGGNGYGKSGGGASYGRGGDDRPPEFGGGGGWSHTTLYCMGADGICIIQYYT